MYSNLIKFYTYCWGMLFYHFLCQHIEKKNQKGLTYGQFSAFPWFSKFGGQRWSWISSEYKHHDDWKLLLHVLEMAAIYQLTMEVSFISCSQCGHAATTRNVLVKVYDGCLANC